MALKSHRTRALLALPVLLALLAAERLAWQSVACMSRPAFAQTAQALAGCLGRDDGPDEALGYLRRWGRADQPDAPERWGDAQALDVLPGHGQELVAIYYPNLVAAPRIDPRGELAVLQQGDKGWRVAFTSGSVAASIDDWQNWQYTLRDAADVTGDGLDDLLLGLSYYNGMHFGLSRAAVLSAHPASGQPELSVVYSADWICRAHRFAQSAGGDVLQLVDLAGASSQPAITTTLRYSGAEFVVEGRQVGAPLEAIGILQELELAIERREWRGPAVDAAYRELRNVFMSPWGHIICRESDAELVVLELVALKLEQIARLEGEHQSADYPPSDQTRASFLETTASRRPASPAPRLAEVVAGADPGQVCAALERELRAHPEYLAELESASQGAIRYAPADVCLGR